MLFALYVCVYSFGRVLSLSLPFEHLWRNRPGSPKIYGKLVRRALTADLITDREHKGLGRRQRGKQYREQTRLTVSKSKSADDSRL